MGFDLIPFRASRDLLHRLDQKNRATFIGSPFDSRASQGGPRNLGKRPGSDRQSEEALSIEATKREGEDQSILSSLPRQHTIPVVSFHALKWGSIFDH